MEEEKEEEEEEEEERQWRNGGDHVKIEQGEVTLTLSHFSLKEIHE